MAYRPEVRRALLAALGRESQQAVRLGAGWALAGDPDDASTRRALLGAAASPHEDPALRREALWSLAGSLHDYEAARRVLGLARETGLDTGVREAAVLALVMLPEGHEARRFLEEAPRSESDPIIRAAALRALGGLTLDLARLFRLPRLRGRPLDPLEDL